MRERKEKVISHYGGHCSCCGCSDIRVLGIDHILGGGRKHREEVGFGTVFYKRVIDDGFPVGYRVLCHNCNSGRQVNGDICPHQINWMKPAILPNPLVSKNDEVYLLNMRAEEVL